LTLSKRPKSFLTPLYAGVNWSKTGPALWCANLIFTSKSIPVRLRDYPQEGRRLHITGAGRKVSCDVTKVVSDETTI